MSADGINGESDISPTVGRYRILARLEQDSIGEILRGFDPLLERPVVVKVFHVGLADPAAKRATADIFFSEMHRTGMLVHQGIVPLFDAGECPAGLFMASEFVDGGNLADFIARDAERGLERGMGLVAQIVDALEYAHVQGVSHLNLKPTNVMVTTDAVVKLAGFGAAVVIDAIAASSGGGTRSPSRWVSPERARGEAGDERSDVFSLAAIIIDLIAGPSHEGEPAVTPAIPASVTARGIQPAAWAAVFDRALHRDPAARYPSVRVLYQDLLLVLGIDPPESRPTWETFGFGTGGGDADTMDSETAMSSGGTHDTQTIGAGGGTPREIVEETRAADAALPRTDGGSKPDKR